LKRSEKYSLLTSCVVPRPIAFVSTVGESGVSNVAPFSFFTPVCYDPPILCVSIGWRAGGQKKDTLRNIEQSRQFVVNVVDEALAGAMNAASFDFPPEVSEFRAAGLTERDAETVSAPLVAEAPVSLECALVDIIRFGPPRGESAAVFGEVVWIHCRDDLWVDGRLDPRRLRPIGRLGGDFYCRAGEVFEMKRPSEPP
jgi:flavin reductase (DIM6/NTAB) family NADH-FMN oxidoreductase RutF